MYYAEINSIDEARRLISTLKSEKTPYSLVLNGASYAFKTVESRNNFIAGLDCFLSLGLPFDVLY